MSVPPTQDLAGLLAEDRWMRRLARRLAADPHTADDLVQDAWVAALSSDGERARVRRSWLGGVVRHLWRDLAHLRAQCARREERAARGEHLPSSGELAEELELRQRVATALLELEEPYRRTLTLRFFRDLSLREIAAAEGLSIAAIHEREQRGLARLRARLVRDGRGRDSWAVALLALGRPRGWLGAGLETIAMASAWKLGTAAVVLGVGGLAWWWHAAEREPLAVAAPEAVQADGPGAALARAPDPAPLAGARERAPVSTPAVPVAPAPVAPARVSGRVLDARGAPVADVRIAWSGLELDSVRSAADGSFTLPAPAEAPVVQGWIGRGTHAQTLHCAEDDYVTLVGGADGEGGQRLVVVAPRTSSAGVVVGGDGAPLAGASVAARVRDSVFPALGVARPGVAPLGPDGRSLGELTVRTDERGAFRLEDVPGGEGLFLAVEAGGHRPGTFELPEPAQLERVLVLEASADERVLEGLVLDPAGRAFEGARVSAGEEITRTDGEGRFRLTLRALPGEPAAELGGEPVLLAVGAGHQPARLALAGLEPGLPVVLQLGPAPRAIRGRVVARDGSPRAGVAVWPRDPTPFGREVLRVAEKVTAAFATTVEDELAGGFGARGTLSDAEGRFELGGLLARRYALLLFDPASAEGGGPFEVEAGSGEVELLLDGGAGCGPVAGRVVTLSGEPLAGVQIRPRRRALASVHEQPPPRAETTLETDGEGRFAFERLCVEGTALELMHPRLLVREVVLEGRADLGDLELVEPVLCELQVDLTRDPAVADSFRVLDAEGQALQLIESFGVGFSLDTSARFQDGLSAV
ncbi:MAG TPA: sigma-70 family RNA polymerase sigma factor, partial [Planctomycetota bacterium]